MQRTKIKNATKQDIAKIICTADPAGFHYCVGIIFHFGEYDQRGYKHANSLLTIDYFLNGDRKRIVIWPYSVKVYKHSTGRISETDAQFLLFCFLKTMFTDFDGLDPNVPSIHLEEPTEEEMKKFLDNY